MSENEDTLFGWDPRADSAADSTAEPIPSTLLRFEQGTSNETFLPSVVSSLAERSEEAAYWSLPPQLADHLPAPPKKKNPASSLLLLSPYTPSQLHSMSGQQMAHYADAGALRRYAAHQLGLTVDPGCDREALLRLIDEARKNVAS